MTYPRWEKQTATASVLALHLVTLGKFTSYLEPPVQAPIGQQTAASCSTRHIVVKDQLSLFRLEYSWSRVQ